VEDAVDRITVDPKTHRVYIPEEEEGDKPVVKIAVYEAVASQ
jgi:hypothetical protein